MMLGHGDVFNKDTYTLIKMAEDAARHILQLQWLQTQTTLTTEQTHTLEDAREDFRTVVNEIEMVRCSRTSELASIERFMARPMGGAPGDGMLLSSRWKPRIDFFDDVLTDKE